ncbi:hypothetical protein [Prevotella sp.]|uniref:hypothetical protein n=1 Tax=Prevotella sp. TaxID=59823 RepID=UPI002F932583
MNKYTHKLINSLTAIAALLLLSACNKDFAEFPQENYDELFPPTEIEKPQTSDNPVVKLGNPYMKVDEFKYMGRDNQTPSQTYKVTIRAAYYEPDNMGPSSAPSLYYIRYVDENGKLVTWSSSNSIEGTSSVLKRNKEQTVSFTLRSGNQVMLIVNGIGERGTGVMGAIDVQDENGLRLLPSFLSRQYQNEEGPNNIQTPFCKYYILP